MSPAGIHRLIGAACAAAVLACTARASQRVGERVTVLTNVTLVTMTAAAPIEGRAVVVEGGRILEIIDDAQARRIAAATIIDGRGMYLAPGLIDAHVHHDEGTDYINLVANGVTTVIGLGQRESGDAFRAIGDSIRRGLAIGPRIYTTDRTIANHIQIEDTTAARAYVRSLRERGFDLVKTYNGISRPVFDAVVAEAERNGLSVFGHLPRGFPVDYALANGLDVVAHAEEFYFTSFGGPRDQELDTFDGSALPDLDRAAGVIDLMVAHEVALIPNLTFAFVTMRFWDDEEAAMADPELRYWRPEFRDAWRRTNGGRRDRIEKRMLRERVKYDFVHEFTRRAHEAGILIVVGTDAPVRGVIPGASMHSELRELVKAGLSSAEALAAATRNGGELVARFVDPSARIGLIAAGYDADLVLVAGNPLADVRNMKRIEGVMVDGTWLDKAELRRRREALAARYAP